MVTEQVRQHYQMLRSTGHHAAYALEAAKRYSGREPSKFTGLAYDEPKTVEIDGFTVKAEVEMDNYGDISDLGEFCMAQPGAISRDPRKVDRGCYTHFLPANPEYGKQDLKRAEDYNDNEWFYTFVTVTVYKQGIKLAWDSCGGIESDSDDDYWAEVADDYVEQTIDEAKEVLAKLCAA